MRKRCADERKNWVFGGKIRKPGKINALKGDKSYEK